MSSIEFRSRGTCEGQVTEFVENDEVHACEILGEPPLPAGVGLALQWRSPAPQLREGFAGCIHGILRYSNSETIADFVRPMAAARAIAPARAMAPAPVPD